MDKTIALTLLKLGVFYLPAYYLFKVASGSISVRNNKRNMYDEWVSRNGNSVKRAILVIAVLYSAAILSQLFFA